jgi:hypothetical protein
MFVFIIHRQEKIDTLGGSVSKTRYPGNKNSRNRCILDLEHSKNYITFQESTDSLLHLATKHQTSKLPNAMTCCAIWPPNTKTPNHQIKRLTAPSCHQTSNLRTTKSNETPNHHDTEAINVLLTDTRQSVTLRMFDHCAIGWQYSFSSTFSTIDRPPGPLPSSVSGG